MLKESVRHNLSSLCEFYGIIGYTTNLQFQFNSNDLTSFKVFYTEFARVHEGHPSYVCACMHIVLPNNMSDSFGMSVYVQLPEPSQMCVCLLLWKYF